MTKDRLLQLLSFLQNIDKPQVPAYIKQLDVVMDGLDTLLKIDLPAIPIDTGPKVEVENAKAHMDYLIKLQGDYAAFQAVRKAARKKSIDKAKVVKREPNDRCACEWLYTCDDGLQFESHDVTPEREDAIAKSL